MERVLLFLRWAGPWTWIGSGALRKTVIFVALELNCQQKGLKDETCGYCSNLARKNLLKIIPVLRRTITPTCRVQFMPRGCTASDMCVTVERPGKKPDAPLLWFPFVQSGSWFIFTGFYAVRREVSGHTRDFPGCTVCRPGFHLQHLHELV